MRSYPCDPALVHNHDHICLDYRAYTLCDNDLRRVGDLVAEGASYLRLGCRVYGRGRVVKDKDLRLL